MIKNTDLIKVLGIAQEALKGPEQDVELTEEAALWLAATIQGHEFDGKVEEGMEILKEHIGGLVLDEDFESEAEDDEWDEDDEWEDDGDDDEDDEDGKN